MDLGPHHDRRPPGLQRDVLDSDSLLLLFFFFLVVCGVTKQTDSLFVWRVKILYIL